MSAHAPITYIVNGQRVTVCPGKELHRVITDFDRKGRLEVLTVVTTTGVWRIFRDGSTSGGEIPSCVELLDTWVSETPTKPDISSVHPKKPV